MNGEPWEGDLAEPIERLAKQVLDIAFKVHTRLGPGLLDRAYVSAMAFELTRGRLSYDREVQIPLR